MIDMLESYMDDSPFIRESGIPVAETDNRVPGEMT
jgi:hypothetical protein